MSTYSAKRDAKAATPLLRFRFDGDGVRQGRMLFDDLSVFVSNVTLAIERIINKIQTGESIRVGRPPQIIRILSALEIVYVRGGSFRLGLDLRRNGHQFPGWDVGEQAIDKLMLAFQAIQQDIELPPECDYGVLISLRDAGRIMEHGIDMVHINSHSSLGRRETQYSRPVREGIQAKIRRYEYSFTTVEGRLTMLDVEEDKLRCRIRPSIGEPISCRFDEALADRIATYLRRFVQARGDASFDSATGKLLSLTIRDLELLGQPSITPAVPMAPSSFWSGKSFEELTSEQAVYPIDDLNRLSVDWPQDADFDSFLDAVRSART